MGAVESVAIDPHASNSVFLMLKSINNGCIARIGVAFKAVMAVDNKIMG